MIRLHLILLLILSGLSTQPVLAQDIDPNDTLTRGQLEKSDTLNPDMPLTNEATEKVYKQCRSFYPLRFTPSALDYYCTCSAAATQGVMTAGEYESIQLERNRKPDNPVYQKYITQVITPCLDVPTLDIEYYACLMNRSNSPEIKNVVSYCKCVSEKLSKHVQKYGDTDAMTRLDTDLMKDPMDAMWASEGYRKAVKVSNEQCRRTNWKPPSVYEDAR